MYLSAPQTSSFFVHLSAPQTSSCSKTLKMFTTFETSKIFKLIPAPRLPDSQFFFKQRILNIPGQNERSRNITKAFEKEKIGYFTVGGAIRDLLCSGTVVKDIDCHAKLDREQIICRTALPQ